MKIIRDSSIGNFSWDYDKNDNINLITNDNNWSTATLQKLLNDSYYNNKDTNYYNNSATEISVNFATEGIGFKTETTRNMVSTSTWYLGECSSEKTNPDSIYQCYW